MENNSRGQAAYSFRLHTTHLGKNICTTLFIIPIWSLNSVNCCFYVLFCGVEHFVFVTAGVDEVLAREAEVGAQIEVLHRVDCLHSAGVDIDGMAGEG